MENQYTLPIKEIDEQDPYKAKPPVRTMRMDYSAPIIPVKPVSLAQLQQSNAIPQRPLNPNVIRSVSYLADYAGCGHYRIMWPDWLLNNTYTLPGKNGKPQITIVDSNVMVFDHNMFYNDMRVIRVQRQATKEQLEFLKNFLFKVAKDRGIPLCYDADDWFFEIPQFNHAYKAYTPEILRNIGEIVHNMNYLTVTSMYLRQLFHEKINIPLDRILVIPNRLPRFLFDGFFDKDRIIERRDKLDKRKPRIMWTGSSTHFSMDPRNPLADDVSVVRNFIHKTANKYQWVFMGVPPDALPYLNMPSNVECHTWCDILNYPRKMLSLNCDLAVIGLHDCNFNRAKSNIKLLELGALGIPAVLQKIEPYKNAPLQWTTIDELETHVNRLLTDKKHYTQTACIQRGFLDKNFWLEDNLDHWAMLYEGRFDELKRITVEDMPKIV